MKSFFKSIGFLLISTVAIAQVGPVGQWRALLSYTNTNSVVDAGDKIYVGCRNGVFYYNRSDNSIHAMSKIDGLNQTEVSTMNYDASTSTLLIAYSNSDIDIIQNGIIRNVPDIKDKSIIGRKSINSIYFHNKFAYIACGFGIVVYDLQRMEVNNTLFIGDGGENVNILQVTVKGDSIYAAGDLGVQEASLNSPNLADFSVWRKHGSSDQYPGGRADGIVCLGDTLYMVNGKKAYKNTGSRWVQASNLYPDVIKLIVSHNKLLLLPNPLYGVYGYDITGKNILVKAFHDDLFDVDDAVYDQDGNVWIAKTNLFRCHNEEEEQILPSGPSTSFSRRLKANANQLLVAPGILTTRYSPGYDHSGFYIFENNSWKSYSGSNVPVLNTVLDMNSITQSPFDGTIYVGSYNGGVVEFSGGTVQHIYETSNSSLQTTVGDPGTIRITGLAVDSRNQLWVSNYGAAAPLSVKRTNGQWQAFSFPSQFFGGFNAIADIIIDRTDQVWVLVQGKGILVFYENPENGDVDYRLLTKGAGSGGLPADFSSIYSLKEDQDGHIWVGTDKGVVVFYNPDLILTLYNTPDVAQVDAQPIKIVQDGLVQLLLETEDVNSITVDGANQKWIGTNNGAWLFSADGTKQIQYFNVDNSPLPSNIINDIAVDPATGEVFFATDKGLTAYRGTTTEGGEINSDVLVFPNPVRHDYNGLISIKGLVKNAHIKITDIAGNIVYQTTAGGGQAVWDGKNFSGEKANTGVYMVLVSNDDGTQTTVQKIFFVN